MFQVSDTNACVIGVGYVGMPLVQAFGKTIKTTGFDIDVTRVGELNKANTNVNINFTASPSAIKTADFVIICVPTPASKQKEPDLSSVIDAARVTGKNLKPGATVILESTVYPGVTEEIMTPILEEGGLKAGVDFKVAYSPERINPGDDEHNVESVTKVVAGMDSETTEAVARLYQLVTPSVYKAASIKVAEAAKVIENTQRDLNIALVNELAMLFNLMGLDTSEVLDAAATKWNFNRYSPGLVGGHCIPVDPYYLVYKARELGFHPQVIIAGRAVNDGMPKYVAELAVKALNIAGKVIKGSNVVIMGLTYKENVADTRESPAHGIIKELKEYGVNVYGFDPLLTGEDIKTTFGIEPVKLAKLNAIKPNCLIFTASHNAFKKLTLTQLKAITVPNTVLIDVRHLFNSEEASKEGFIYRAL